MCRAEEPENSLNLLSFLEKSYSALTFKRKVRIRFDGGHFSRSHLSITHQDGT